MSMSRLLFLLTSFAISLSAELLCDELRLNEFQYKGTHNSYRLSPDYCNLGGKEVIDDKRLFENCGSFAEMLGIYDHSMPAIEDQLKLGVRVLELDVWHRANVPVDDPANVDGLFIYHAPNFHNIIEFSPEAKQNLDPTGTAGDNGSMCKDLQGCLRKVKKFSDANLNHEPIGVMFEAKDFGDYEVLFGLAGGKPASDDRILRSMASPAEIESAVKEVWGGDGDLAKVIRPADIVGDSTTMREALEGGVNPWPAMSESRGKVYFVYWSKQPWFVRFKPYSAGSRPTSLEEYTSYLAKYPRSEQWMFLKTSCGDDPSELLDGGNFSAFVDCGGGQGEEGAKEIRSLVENNYMVRVWPSNAGTRYADVLTEHATAIRTGATIVSSDFVGVRSGSECKRVNVEGEEGGVPCSFDAFKRTNEPLKGDEARKNCEYTPVSVASSGSTASSSFCIILATVFVLRLHTLMVL